MKMNPRMVVRRKEDLANMLGLLVWCGRSECASKVRYDGLCLFWLVGALHGGVVLRVGGEKGAFTLKNSSRAGG